MITDNSIYPEVATALAQALKRNTSLQLLDLRGTALTTLHGPDTQVLSGTRIASMGATAIAHALESNTSIHSLHLEGTTLNFFPTNGDRRINSI